MIKSISLLTRRPELTHEQFMTHWVEIHAPLAHAVPGLRRYIQNHIRDERTRPDIATTEVAVDGLKQAQQMAEMQSNGLKRLVPAFQALYDSLSDPQKKTADQVLGGGEEAGGPQGGAPAGKRR